MKKEFSARPETISEVFCQVCGGFSWYDFVTAMPSLVFVVTGWKGNGKQNACLHSWSAFAGSGADNFICVMNKVNPHGHMYKSLRETGVCVLNFPSRDVYEKCIKTIGNNGNDTDEITAAGLTAEPARLVNAPRIRECFLNIECEYLWEHELFPGSGELAVALKAVGITMDKKRYDQTQLGRYGSAGYLYQIDQPINPDTGKRAAILAGTVTPCDGIEWKTK